MKQYLFLLALPIWLLLAACSPVEEDQTVDFSGWEKAYMIYSYPFDGQQNVSVKTAVSLMFTHTIDDPYLASHVRVLDKDGNPVAGTITEQNGNDAGLVFTPEQALKAGEVYTIEYTGLTSTIGEVADARTISFSTVGVSGDASSVPGEDPTGADPFTFQVIREFPTEDVPFMDFSVIHLTFNKAIDINSVGLDNGFSFTEPGQTQSVAGKLMVKDTYIIFDPDEDLKPGVEYTLSLKDSIKSRSGMSLSVGDYASKVYVPNDSQPRSVLVQKIYGEPDVNVSPLSGLDRNTVPVNSTLMGDVISYADSDYFTELAYIPNYADAVPFVIRRGAIVKGSKMDVNIGGKVSGGYDTGEIYLTLITDATGYMVANKNTNDPNAPKQVRLVMDVSMSAQDPRANGGLSQDVLHIDLFGIGYTENGVLVVDTLGEINPTLLGVEKANGLVSFFLEAYADQDNAPIKPVDDVPPQLQTWLPGDIGDRVDPADPVFLIFTEPLRPENLNQEITVTRVGQTTEQVPVVVTHDGTSVIVKPNEPLKYGSNYQVRIGENVMDMAGNPVASPFTLSFTTLNYDTSKLAAPMVGSIYPGYNCRMVDADFANNRAGRCEGGKGTDDYFDVFKQPANRPVQVTFNQLMDTSTFTLGTECGQGSVRVEEVNVETGECIAPVHGSIQYDASRLMFEPTLPWSETKLYQIVLNSSTSSACDGSDSVLCSDRGLPLRTVPLTVTFDNRQQGSGAMVIPFRGTDPEVNKVYNPLSKLPTVDVNRNFEYDSTETTADATGSAIVENATKLSIAGFGGLIRKATIGCGVDVNPSNCADDKKSIYVSGYLPTEVGVYEEYQVWDEAKQETVTKVRIPVDLHSQVLMTTSVTMYTEAILGIDIISATGPQIMRMRNRKDENGNMLPGIGYILFDEGYPDINGGGGSEAPGQAMFKSTMEVYLDAPGLKPTAPILGEMETNMHSLPLTIELYGPIVFLPDGRMEIRLQNQNTVDIDVEVGSDSNVDLKIYPGDLSINLVSKMVKS